MRWLRCFYAIAFVFLMGAASGLEQIPCDDACQMELLKNDDVRSFIVDGCLFVKDEEEGDFLVCDEEAAVTLKFFYRISAGRHGGDQSQHHKTFVGPYSEERFLQ